MYGSIQYSLYRFLPDGTFDRCCGHTEFDGPQQRLIETNSYQYVRCNLDASNYTYYPEELIHSYRCGKGKYTPKNALISYRFFEGYYFPMMETNPTKQPICE
jgi:hypothetical protein